jgi:hypothetical protein
MKEIEEIRREATNIGIAATVAIFGLNEVARMALRSRKCYSHFNLFIAMFKLRVQNVLFWGIVPTLFVQYSYNQSVHNRINNLWRIHRFREQKGLGGTYTSTGIVGEED